MRSPDRLVRRAVWMIGALLLAAMLAALLAACGRRSPTGPGNPTRLRIDAVLPAGCPTCPGPQQAPGTASATATASVDSMDVLLLVYEQTDDGENLLTSRAYHPESYAVPDSVLSWEVAVPWAFRYRIEVQALGQRYFTGNYFTYTGVGLQYLGDAVVSSVPSLPERVTIPLRDVVPMPRLFTPDVGGESLVWNRIVGALSYTVHGAYVSGASADLTVRDSTVAFLDFVSAAVRANLPYGRTSAFGPTLFKAMLQPRLAGSDVPRARQSRVLTRPVE